MLSYDFANKRGTMSELSTAEKQTFDLTKAMGQAWQGLDEVQKQLKTPSVKIRRDIRKI
jgi:hypothetical protein